MDLSIAVKEVEKIVEKSIGKYMKSTSQDANVQTNESKTSHNPKIDVKPKISYDIRREANYPIGMTCGGWTFFANKKEGNHLWAVNDKGTEYCELYSKTISFVNAIRIMNLAGVEHNTVSQVLNIIEKVSFKGIDSELPDTIEGKIVQDADRLNAMRAIGISRAFAYGGAKGRIMYDQDFTQKYDEYRL